MTSGRPSPAALEIPLDQLPAVAEVTPCDPLPRHPAPTPDPEKIARLAGMLDAARNPMIWIGGGALDAGPAIRALAERIGAPVVRFRSARGVLDDRHPLSMTVPAAYKLWPETDLLVAFGTRLDVPASRWGRLPEGLAHRAHRHRPGGDAPPRRRSRHRGGCRGGGAGAGRRGRAARGRRTRRRHRPARAETEQEIQSSSRRCPSSRRSARCCPRTASSATR